jgi:hypothetical protein
MAAVNSAGRSSAGSPGPTSSAARRAKFSMRWYAAAASCSASSVYSITER